MKIFEGQTPRDIAISILQITVSVAVVVLTALYMFEVWAGFIYIVLPLTSLELFLMAHMFWKRARGTAIFSIVSASVVAACAIINFILLLI